MRFSALFAALVEAFFVALFVAVLPGRADAFVRRLNSAGQPIFWKEGCVPVTIYLNGFDKTTAPNKFGLDVPGIVKSVVAAAHAWSADALTCSPSGDGPSFEIVPTLAPLDAAPPAVGYDARNSIIFRLDKWSWGASDALAHTNVIPSNDDGHILDVDIEINAATPGQVWMSLDPGVLLPPDPPHQSEVTRFFDLQAVLTHEFGHFIGLAHSCYRTEDGPHLRDDQGNLIPDCMQGMDATSVMDPTIDAGQARQRTLFPDDISAACTIYDPARSVPLCALDTPSPGCAAAPPRRSSRAGLFAGAALSVGAALSALARRRARVSARGRARA
jgi:hypothetical protein